MIPAGQTELRNAYWRHIRRDKESLYLLQFYAVECGLKGIFLRQYHLSTTEKITNEALRGSHDLAQLVKELRLPASLAGTISFRLRRDNSSWHLKQVHEAWRYGVSLNEDDQIQVVEHLNKLHAWISENLPK